MTNPDLPTISRTFLESLRSSGASAPLRKALLSHGILSAEALVRSTRSPEALDGLAIHLGCPAPELKALREAIISAHPDAVERCTYACKAPVAFGLCAIDDPLANSDQQEAKRREAVLRRVEEDLTRAPALIEVDHRHRLHPIRDQGMFGFCWAFATTAVVEGCLQDDTGTNCAELSPAFIITHIKAKGLDPWPNSEGGNPYYALKAMQEVGCCAEATFPYEPPFDLSAAPTSEKYREAAKLLDQIGGTLPVYHCQEVDPRKLARLLHGIDDLPGRPVTVGILPTRGFLEVDESGFIAAPTPEEIREAKDWLKEGKISRHAMAMVGVRQVTIAADVTGDEELKITYFIVRNSWSESHGDHGYLYIHEDYVARLMHASYTMLTPAETDFWDRQSTTSYSLRPLKRQRQKPRRKLVALSLLALIIAAGLSWMSPGCVHEGAPLVESLHAWTWPGHQAVDFPHHDTAPPEAGMNKPPRSASPSSWEAAWQRLMEFYESANDP